MNIGHILSPLGCSQLISCPVSHNMIDLNGYIGILTDTKKTKKTQGVVVFLTVHHSMSQVEENVQYICVPEGAR